MKCYKAALLQWCVTLGSAKEQVHILQGIISYERKKKKFLLFSAKASIVLHFLRNCFAIGL